MLYRAYQDTKKPATRVYKLPVYNYLNGAPGWTRTSGPLLRRQRGNTQKSLQTLGETQPDKKNVTQNVTFFSETSPQTSLLKALQALPREELLKLLVETLQNH